MPELVRADSETILVVEDDALVRDYVLDAVCRASATSRCRPANAAEALRGRRRAGQAFDLLFTDVIMPGA